MTIAAIVVTDQNNAIGKNNQLLCHLPADLKFFKATTMGHPIIMGRKTYESIGRLLPGRRNLVVTQRSDYKIEGAEIYHSIGAAFENCHLEDKVFVIGGSQIFKQTLHVTHEIFRTLILSRFEADTYFPEIDPAEFEMVWEECHQADEKNKFDYCFQRWIRRSA